MPPPQCPTRTASAPCRCATHTPPLVCAPSSSPEKQPYTWAGLNQRNPSNQSVLSRFTMHIQVKFGLVPTRLTEHSENSSSIIVQQAAGPPNKLFNPSSCCNPSLLSSPRYLWCSPILLLILIVPTKSVDKFWRGAWAATTRTSPAAVCRTLGLGGAVQVPTLAHCKQPLKPWKPWNPQVAKPANWLPHGLGQILTKTQ